MESSRTSSNIGPLHSEAQQCSEQPRCISAGAIATIEAGNHCLQTAFDEALATADACIRESGDQSAIVGTLWGLSRLACLHARSDVLHATLQHAMKLPPTSQVAVLHAGGNMLLAGSSTGGVAPLPDPPIISPAEEAAAERAATSTGTLALAATIGASPDCMQLLLGLQGAGALKQAQLLPAAEFLCVAAAHDSKRAAAPNAGAVACGRLGVVAQLLRATDPAQLLPWDTCLQLCAGMRRDTLLCMAQAHLATADEALFYMAVGLLQALSRGGRSDLLVELQDPSSPAASHVPPAKHRDFWKRVTARSPAIAAALQPSQLLLSACRAPGHAEQAACVQAALGAMRAHAEDDAAPAAASAQLSGTATGLAVLGTCRLATCRGKPAKRAPPPLDAWTALASAVGSGDTTPEQGAQLCLVLMRGIARDACAAVPDLSAALVYCAGKGDSRGMALLWAAFQQAKKDDIPCALRLHAWKHCAFRQACAAAQQCQGGIRCMQLLDQWGGAGGVKWNANHQSALFTACIRFCVPVLKRFIALQRGGRHVMHLQARRGVFLRHAWTRLLQAAAGMGDQCSEQGMETVMLLLGCAGRFNAPPVKVLQGLPESDDLGVSWRRMLRDIAWKGGSMRTARGGVLMCRHAAQHAFV